MEFISYENPSEFNSEKINLKIRRHVTKRQHRLKREAELENREERERSDNVRPARDPSHSMPERQLRPDQQASTQPNMALSNRKKSSRKSAVSTRSNSPRLPPQVPYQIMYPCNSAFNTLESYIHGSMIPTHVSALGLKNIDSECQSSSHWFSSSSVTEPALYTSALLTAAPNFNRISPDLLLYLQSATITSLVSALSSEERRQDPALVLAVECLTFYECLFGDRFLAQRVHRPAMRRLIRAHGGRDGLEIPRSWKKVSLMADIVMEIQMGSEGESSFLEEEQHENAAIMEAEWTESLRMYLPEIEEGSSKQSSQSR